MTKATCTTEGCATEGKIRGLCEKHYRKAYKAGARAPKLTDLERFYSKTDRGGSCWQWRGTLNERGYPYLYVKGRMRRAHRYSYEQHVGAIPEGAELDHSCHNRACVNPAHLRLATHKQNSEYLRGANSANLSSGLRGISKRGDRWMVRIGHQGEVLYFGTYATIEEAEEVAIRERARLFHFPEAKRNAA